MTHYETLQVAQTATAEEIKAAHRKMAAALHPDRNAATAHLFRQVQEAYEVLSDPAKRAAYDRSLKVCEIPRAASGAIHQDGSIDLFMLAGRFTPAEMQQAIFPALGRVLSGRGVDPQHATIEQMMGAFGLVKKPRGRKRA